ncbi:MAG: ATPase, partial [Bacteroidetes bacterium]|nr:ATPase [Bacteroidota bacterium]
FLISERIKLQAYHRQQAMNFFWRTVAKQEIDFVEERNGRITAYEFKWSPRAKAKIPASFLKSYHATGVIIDRSNFRSLVRADVDVDVD